MRVKEKTQDVKLQKISIFQGTFQHQQIEM